MWHVVAGLSNKYIYILKEKHATQKYIYIRYVTLTSNPVYSVVWNKSTTTTTSTSTTTSITPIKTKQTYTRLI